MGSGVASAERLDPGPVALGSRYRLGVRMGGRVAPMEYEVAVLDVPRRVVLVGSGSGVSAVDDVRFETTPAGTRIEYTADIRLVDGCASSSRCSERHSEKIGREAADGMRRASTSAPRARRGEGRGMKVAVIGSGVSGLSAA